MCRPQSGHNCSISIETTVYMRYAILHNVYVLSTKARWLPDSWLLTQILDLQIVLCSWPLEVAVILHERRNVEHQHIMIITTMLVFVPLKWETAPEIVRVDPKCRLLHYISTVKSSDSISRRHAHSCEPQSCHHAQIDKLKAYCFCFRFLKRSSSWATFRSCSARRSAFKVLATATLSRSSCSLDSANVSLLLRRCTLSSTHNSSAWVSAKYTSRSWESWLCLRRRDVETFHMHKSIHRKWWRNCVMSHIHAGHKYTQALNALSQTTSGIVCYDCPRAIHHGIKGCMCNLFWIKGWSRSVPAQVCYVQVCLK